MVTIPHRWVVGQAQKEYSMGLTAVVFKSASRLEKEYSREFQIVDAETGESAAVDGWDPALDLLVAAEATLGNIAEVAFLREAVGPVLGDTSFIAESVLYSGSHSGDAIPIDRFHLLRDELNRLKKINDDSVTRFVNAMEMLLTVAAYENNPIVFV
jgi:hypothetical protein